jgi:serine/threonine-protein kinase RsbW
VKTKQHRRKELVVMSAPYTFKAVRSNPESAGASIEVELIMKSELGALLSVVEELMHFVRKSDCVPGQEPDVEVALRAALSNAVLHGNREDPGKQVHIRCRCGPGKEVSIIIEDEGQGFDTTAVLYPAVVERPKSHSQRGIQLMRICMDEVHFEHGGREVHMRKRLPSVTNPHLVP